jgi:hypothetical protein
VGVIEGRMTMRKIAIDSELQIQLGWKAVGGPLRTEECVELQPPLTEAAAFIGDGISEAEGPGSIT